VCALKTIAVVTRAEEGVAEEGIEGRVLQSFHKMLQGLIAVIS